MKRYKILIIFIALFSLAFILFFSNNCLASVKGDCEACHALYPGMMETPEPGKPPQYVLKSAFCIDCHLAIDGECWC